MPGRTPYRGTLAVQSSAKQVPPRESDRTVVDFERLLPPRVTSGEIRLAKFVLTPFGLASDSVGDITIDGRVALVQPHPESELFLCPLAPNPQPDISTAWFYADCIAYDHDIPVIVRPTPGDIRRFGFRYIYSGTHRPQPVHYENFDTGESSIKYHKSLPPHHLAKLFFNEELFTILSEIRDFHHGPMTYILFRHEAWMRRLDLPYAHAYGAASQEIHLYAAALRQADTLTEYLFYYRVIESATSSNGKAWIASALRRLATHGFDPIRIGFGDERGTSDLMRIYRRRSLRRLKSLATKYGTLPAIADYLYHVNRCGIAHGKQIIRADITPSYFEMVRDTYIMKLLARMAIDMRLGARRL